MSYQHDYEYVRDYYGVPAKRGARVRYTGGSEPRLGTVTAADGAHVRIRLDGDKRAERYHPTWELEWLENAPATERSGGDEHA